jgi:alcohol dehydrogenase class IV
MATFQFRTVPHIHAGRGSATELATIAAPLLAGVERVVLVTDRGVRQAGLIDAPLGELEVAGLSVLVLDEVIADPPEDMVLAATARARDFGAQLVIGFGGGSSLDTAKLVALLLGSDQPTDFCRDRRRNVENGGQ